MEPAAEWSVLLGAHSQDGPLDGAHVRAVAAILVPDNFTRVDLGADLALLRLASPARLGPAVRPVCLPRASHRFAHGAACWATGWGDIQEDDRLPLPWVLQEVELRLLGEAACQCLYSRPGPFNLTFQLLPGMLCAGYPEGRRDTCQGDSGGPLVCEEGGRWFQAGITSFGFGCGRRNRPGVFTAVAPYEAWIRERVMGSEPGPAFPSRSGEPQSGPREPREGNCTIALPECGKAPRPGAWPWEAQVMVPGSRPCRGALVSESWVLAPASCFLEARGRSPRPARGRAVERLVVSLPVRPPGGAGAAAGRPAARAVPRLPGGGGGGPLLERLALEPSVSGGGDLVPGRNRPPLQWLPTSQSLLPAADPRPLDQPCDSGSLPRRPADLGLGP